MGILPVDAHLMIEDPDRWAPPQYRGGRHSVTLHAGRGRVRLAGYAVWERRLAWPSSGDGSAPFVDILNEFDMISS